MNLLATTAYSLMPDFSIGLDFLGEFARAIIEGVGILGLGIILFTLVLKAITLPFDIYQRYKMRKQTLIMKGMKDDLEKLQKQYANDKTTYNMKMQELYKKNGYSMLGACLPMIISLVILIVAFQGFNSYSRYATVQLFVNMKDTYNSAVLDHCAGGVEGGDKIVVTEDGTGIPLSDLDGTQKLVREDAERGLRYTIRYEEDNVSVYDENGNSVLDENGASVIEKMQIPYLYVENTDEGADCFLYYRYRLASCRLIRSESGETQQTYDPISADDLQYERYLDSDAVKTFLGKASEGSYERSVYEQLLAAEAEEDATEDENEKKASVAKQLDLCTKYLNHLGAVAAADWYREGGGKESASFLWIKNVWYADASYKNPVPKETVSASLSQTQYDLLTSELGEEKNAPNGYYVLIVLSIAMMALSQFITMRSNKESNKYQTVDGQGAMSQKVMLVIMPLIYAVFAFLYSAAFSIYMIISSLISLLVTVICNLVLGRIFRKKEEDAIKAQYGRSVPWKKDKSAPKKEKKRK